MTENLIQISTRTIEEKISYTFAFRNLFTNRKYRCKHCGSYNISLRYNEVLLKNPKTEKNKVEIRDERYYCEKCKIQSPQIEDIAKSTVDMNCDTA